MGKGTYKKYKISEAISIIAHQLKNPVAILRGYIESLLSGDCGPTTTEQKDYLSDTLLTVKKMTNTIDSMIDVSLIEQEKYRLDLKSVFLADVVFDVLSDFFHWAKAANCKITFKKPKLLPRALTDPNKIRIVVENIVSNAIKYNLGRGLIDVSVSLRKVKKEVMFSCKDNGVGIPKKDFPKVFTKYYRSEKAMEIDPSGSGIGLYISKAIIDLSGGRIWFEKNKKAGMIFYFTLPIAKHG